MLEFLEGTGNRGAQMRFVPGSRRCRGETAELVKHLVVDVSRRRVLYAQ